MTSIHASEARDRLYRLLDEAGEAHEPILITGPRSNVVLVGYLAGAHSRRINIQNRLGYQGLDHEHTIEVLRMWTHYDDARPRGSICVTEQLPLKGRAA